MDDLKVFERLVPAGEAFDLLVNAHDRINTYANFGECRAEVIETLLARLLHGALKAWAITCSIDSTEDTETPLPEEIISDWDFHYGQSIAPIPLSFWCHFSNAPNHHRSFDSVAGDFRFSYTDFADSFRTGIACGVLFDLRGLPAAAIPGRMTELISQPNAPAKKTENAPDIVPAVIVSGRKPAQTWADFAEELAVYIHEVGMPEGDGASGQSTMLAEIEGRLMVQGRGCPSRTTLQPVVRAVLRRLRA